MILTGPPGLAWRAREKRFPGLARIIVRPVRGNAWLITREQHYVELCGVAGL